MVPGLTAFTLPLTHTPSLMPQELCGGVDASDYSVVFLPWGPGFDARKSVRLMATKAGWAQGGGVGML